MAGWIKGVLWIAVVLLPGGILLAPVLIGVHERERRARLRAAHDGEPAHRP